MAKSVGSLVAGRASTDSFDGIIGFRTERENRMATTRILSISIALALAAGSGCVREVVDCAGNPSPVCADTGPRADTNSDAFSLFDAPTDDVGADAFNQPDSGLDGGICSRCPTAMPACLGGERCVQCTADNTTACPDDAPACDTETNTCVECNTSTDCTGDTTPVCDVEAHRCVPCLSSDTGACGGVTPACDTNNTCTCTDDSCTSVAAALCNTTSNSCEACGGAADCAHLPATPQCRAGTCVQCLNNTHCAANQACNTTTNQCVSITLGGAARCDTCLRDTQCAAGMLCVPVIYDDPTTPAADPVNTGLHCLQQEAPVVDCLLTRPFSTSTPTTSVDGVAADVCGLRRSTCEAEAAYDSTNCMTLDTAGNDRCGLPGVNDGVCRMRSSTTNRCSVYCTSNDDCRPGVICDTVAGICRF